MSSSKLNSSKSEALDNARDSLTERVLPGRLMWNTGGLKYLGVFLSDDIWKKNWDRALESIRWRLKKWKLVLLSILLAAGLSISTIWCPRFGTDWQWWTLPLVCYHGCRLNWSTFLGESLDWLPQAVLFLRHRAYPFSWTLYGTGNWNSLKEDILSEMVTLKYFGDTKNTICLRRQIIVKDAHVPLSVQIFFQESQRHFCFSINDSFISCHSCLGRIIVCCNTEDNTWHGPCAKARRSCVHRKRQLMAPIPDKPGHFQNRGCKYSTTKAPALFLSATRWYFGPACKALFHE